MTSARAAGRVFILSAPSGAGKTTLAARLLRRVSGLVRSVSLTTRPPRPGERQGRDYTFVTAAVFGARKRRGVLLECARVHGAWYGTPRTDVTRWLRAGRDVLLSIDVQGARQIRRALPGSVLIFVLPPSLASLRQRLEGRRTESREQIRRRMAWATREMQAAQSYDYIVVNDDLQRALAQLQGIMLAERCRVHRPARPMRRRAPRMHAAS